MASRVSILAFCVLISSMSVYEVNDVNSNLMSAAGRGDLRIFKAMTLAMGANPNALDKGQNTAILMAAYHSQREMVRRLLELHADVNMLGSIGFTPVGAAAMRGVMPEIVRMLIGAGASLDAQTTGEKRRCCANTFSARRECGTLS